MRGAVTVSIHAPARGATIVVPSGATEIPVSIHAPARGATNPAGLLRALLRVSIHAPARGATSSATHSGTDAGFNSRAREGRDLPVSHPPCFVSVFQFTRPRGARPGT